MRAWGIIHKGDCKCAEAIISIDIGKRSELPDNPDYALNLIGELTHALDVERPVLTKKHLSDLKRFGHTVFLPTDFIDTIDFDKLTVEIIA